jgi:hypothetical protein
VVVIIIIKYLIRKADTLKIKIMYRSYLVCARYIDDDESQKSFEQQGEVEDPVVHWPLQNRQPSRPIKKLK